MECLRDYIGLRGCSNETPESGLYINSLSGISLDSLQGMASAERDTYIEVWDDIQTRTIRRFDYEVSKEFNKRYRLKRIPLSIDAGRRTISGSAEAITETNIGILIDTGVTDTTFVRSQLGTLAVQEVWFYKLEFAPAQLNIYSIGNSGITTDVLYSKTLTGLVSGWNKIHIGQNFEAEKLHISFEWDSGEEAIQSPLPNSNLFNSMSREYFSCNCKATIKGIKFDDISNVTETAYTNGISVVFSLRCSYEKLVCANKEQFALPFYYLLGLEVMTERLGNDRINQWTLNTEKAKEFAALYEHQFKESLESIVGGIDINDFCLECSGNRIIEQHP